MEIKFCLTVQSHLHQIQYIHMAHGFPPPLCTGKKFIQDENGKIILSFFLLLINVIALNIPEQIGLVPGFFSIGFMLLNL